MFTFTATTKGINELNQLVTSSVQESEEILKHSISEMDNPALSGLTCNPDYLNLLSNGCRDCLQSVLNTQRNDSVQIVILAARIAHRHSLYLIEGRATSNASPDIMFGERE